ncbi:hypothetical protein K1719_014825 [Acacia pycnantha]|nr:hypothetical protein K1719_014825 [Acacia pycnantha]
MYAASMAMSKWKNGVGPNIEQQVMENVAKVEYMDLQIYGGGRVQVRTASGALKVEVHLRECTCKAWQMSGIPCPHVCGPIEAGKAIDGRG